MEGDAWQIIRRCLQEWFSMKAALFSIVDDKRISPFTVYYLSSLKEVADEIIVISNCEINEDDISLLKKTGVTQYYYKPELPINLMQWGFLLADNESLKSADEILFCTGNVYGPMSQLGTLWSNDKTRQCDAWGLLRKPGYSDSQQSEFFVVRKNVIESSEFRNYWTGVNDCGAEEIRNGFPYFGTYLEKNGFRVKYLIDEYFNELCNNPEISLADELLRQGFPFVNKYVFRQTSEQLLSETNASQCEKSLQYIKSSTDYPLGLIVRDLTENLENSELIQRLHLAFLIPVRNEAGQSGTSSKCAYVSENEKNKTVRHPKCALIIYTFYDDLFERNMRIIERVPQDFTVVIVTSNDSLFNKWLGLKDKIMNLEVRKQINRGRNESCYWVTCRDIIQTSDYICLMHDKKTNYWGGKPIKGRTYAYNAINSLVKSRDYIKNIVSIFENNPFIGLLMPFPPMFCGIDYVIRDPWCFNIKIARDLYKTLGLRVPFDRYPRAPWGGMFWIRGKAMSSLLRKKWKYSDFPPEPVKPDGTLLHALERMYPMLVQDAGYLSAFVCPSSEFGSAYFNTYSVLKTRDLRCRKLEQDLKKRDAGNSIKAPQQKVHKANPHSNASTAAGMHHRNFPGHLLSACRKFWIKHKLKHEKKNLSCFFLHKSEIWDSGYYLKTNPDVAKARAVPLEHYIEKGWKEGRSPSERCITEEYLKVNADCKLLDISPLEHYYVNCRKRALFWSYSDLSDYTKKNGTEILKRSSWFNLNYYLRNYKKKYGNIPEGFDPYSYYLEHGAYETIKPSRFFRVHAYFEQFPEIKIYGICPVVHYELIGKYL